MHGASELASSFAFDMPCGACYATTHQLDEVLADVLVHNKLVEVLRSVLHQDTHTVSPHERACMIACAIALVSLSRA